MKKVLAMLLALTTMFSLVACGSTDTSPDSSNDGGASVGGEGSTSPKVLTIGLDAEPTSMDPNDQSDGQGSMFVCYGLYETLWMYTVDGEETMHLAKAYEYTGDTELTVTLRDDIYFSNGSPITADDVLWSMQYSAQGTGAMRLTNIDVVNSVAVDDQTLKLALYKQAPTLIEDLAQLRILSQEWCTQGQDNITFDPVSSGAYVLESWETGMGVTLTRNEYYYDNADVYYDEVDITFIPSEETRLLSFENGDFDLICLSNSASVDEINDGVVDGASVFVGQIQSITGMVMTTTFSDYDTFQDQRVRQAIGYAIDVPAMVQTICGSAYTVATGYLPSSNWAYLETGNYDYDLTKAQQLMTEAGYSEDNRFAFVFTVSDVGYNMQLAEAIQAYLAEAYIDMSIDPVDGATLMTMMIGNQIQASFSSYMGSNDPAGVCNARRAGLPAHMSAFGDEALSALMEECCDSMDDRATRTALWHDLQQQAYEYANFIPLYESNVLYAVSENINSDSLAASMQADGYLFPTFIKGNG